LLAQAVRVYLSNQRQATAKTKTRSEVVRTKKKWFRQKGTGNARHGARTANIFVGGGTVHGPTGTQNYDLKLTAKMKQQALISALCAQAANTFVNDDLAKADGKTKSAIKILGDKLVDNKRLLLIVDQKTPAMVRSYNNLPTVYLVTANYVNLLHLVNADTILMTNASLTSLQKRLMGGE